MKKKTKKAQSSRLEAARIIASWLAAGRFPDRELAGIKQDRAYLTEVVFGVVRGLRALQYLRSRLAARKPATPIEAVLLVGLHELFFLDDTPGYAAVHEAVESARNLGGTRAGAFVNAILRRAQREEEKLRADLGRAAPGIRLSHPDALIERWRRHFGDRRAFDLCQWNNARPETVLHVLKRRIAFDDFIERARKGGIELTPHAARPSDCIVLPRGIPVEEVPGFSDGQFVVQDPSTLGAVDLLAPRPGETIVDACASPGGKAAAIWDRMADGGRQLSCDIHEDRLARLRENFQRLKIQDIEVAMTDSADRTRLEEAMKRAHMSAPDAILLDVPCSNTGVLRRRADARWRFDETRLAQLIELQARMLVVAASLLRPGGRIVYSTCSIEPEENERQIQRFLAAHPSFTLEAEVKSFPPESGMDGAYAARLASR